MTDFLDRLVRDMSRYRDEQETIAEEHQRIADAARAEQNRVEAALTALRQASRSS